MLRIESWPPEPTDMAFTPFAVEQIRDYASRDESAAVQAIGGAVASFVAENMPNPTSERAYAAFDHITAEVQHVNGAGIDLGAGFRSAYNELTRVGGEA